MGVPLEIRQVPRPKNTIVDDNKRPGPFQYAVRERSGVSYVSSGNPKPRNGKVIGHIFNGKFVPVETQKQTKESKPSMLSYGSYELARSLSKDIFDDLVDVFPGDKAYAIMVISILRVIRPNVTMSRMSTQYKKSFLSLFFPGTHLSKNYISNLFDNIGQDVFRRRTFYAKRLERVCKEHHIAIDGTLKQNNSIVNDLAHFSYKSKVKGTRDISVLYAYDVENKEPLCATVFPGNCIDASAYGRFIKENKITKGIIVDDKGFPVNNIRSELANNPELHYLTPIKRNDRRITKYNALTFTEVVSGIGKHIVGNKVSLPDGTFLYAFRDTDLAHFEEIAYMSNSEKKKEFDADKFAKQTSSFGTIVFESDVDMSVKDAYLTYDSRWLLEVMFKQYKSNEALEKTRVQGDFSVIGSEFVNFISTLITNRIINHARECGVLDEMSYGDMMEDLNSVWRYTDAPQAPSRSDGGWAHSIPSDIELMEKLKLSSVSYTEQKKKESEEKEALKEDAEKQVKRPRGRPRKQK